MSTAITSELESSLAGIADQFKNFAKQMQEVGSALQRVAAAGFEATNEGNKLSFIWSKFTQQIASVALPVMNFLIEKITKITDWFRNLTSDGQGLLLKVGGIAVVFTSVVAVVSALSAVMSPLAAVLGLIAAGLYVFFTETDAGKAIMDSVTEAVKWMISHWNDLIDVFDKVKFSISIAIDSVLAVIARLTAGVARIVAEVLDWIPGLSEAQKSVSGFADRASADADALTASANRAFVPRERKADTSGPGKQVNPTGFAFESLSASFERITSNANKTDLAKEALEVSKAQLAQQVIIAGGIGGLKNEVKPKGDH